MKTAISFIHTADLHLGSTIQPPGDIPGHIQEKLEEAVSRSFSRIVDFALAHNVDFVVIAGDIFDRRQRSIAAVKFFNEQCRRLGAEDIRVLAITGNHDPYFEEEQLLQPPANLHLFGAEEVAVEKIYNKEEQLIARVLGQSYRGNSDSRKMYSFYTAADRGVWNIGLLHTQLDPHNTHYVPCSRADLESKDDIDYWALGHIHQTRNLGEGRPRLAYPGIPQGRDIGEPGPGGCLLVELTPDNGSNTQFMPAAPIIWKTAEITLDKLESPPVNLNELAELMQERGEQLLAEIPEYSHTFTVNTCDYYPDGVIVRWLIRGRSVLAEKINERQEAAAELERQLREYFQARSPFLWTESVELRISESLPRWQQLKTESRLTAEMAEVVKALAEDEEMRQDLKEELGNIWEDEVDHENFREDKFQLKEEIMEEIIEEAKWRAAARIWQERGTNS